MNTELTACCKPWRTFFIPARCKATGFFSMLAQTACSKSDLLANAASASASRARKKRKFADRKIAGHAGGSCRAWEGKGWVWVYSPSFPSASAILLSLLLLLHPHTTAFSLTLTGRGKGEREGGDTGKGYEHWRCGSMKADFR